MSPLDDRRWEYQFARVTPDVHGTTALSALGAKGWRVVHVTVPGEDRGVVHALLERERVPPDAAT
jgi:hypothetical protein